MGSRRMNTSQEVTRRLDDLHGPWFDREPKDLVVGNCQSLQVVGDLALQGVLTAVVLCPLQGASIACPSGLHPI